MLLGCRHFGYKPKPVGISEVKAVGAGAREWDDGQGGVWRYYAQDKLTWEGAQAMCDQLGGVTGRRWRVPSTAELVAARGQGISGPTNKAFGWVHLGPTWAADWDTHVNDQAITGGYVDMVDGAPHRATYDDLKFAVLCVRTDAGGSAWTESGGIRSWWYIAKRMDYETAEITCAALADRRHEPWRLPRVEDVRNGIEQGMRRSENKAFGRDYLTFIWSAEVAPVLDSEEAFVVDVRTGASVLVDVDEVLRVVCVADGVHGGKAVKPAPAPKGPTGKKPATQ